MVDEISICDIRDLEEMRRKINSKVTTMLPRINDYPIDSSYSRYARYNIHIACEHASRKKTRIHGGGRARTFVILLDFTVKIANDKETLELLRARIVSLSTLHFASVMNTQHLTVLHVTLVTLKNRVKRSTLL